MAIHCSGALSLDALAPAAAEGAAVGSFHPLLSLASADTELAGAAAAIEGDDRSLPVLRTVTAALGMEAIELEAGQKPLYHAAATLLSNYTVTLFDLAARIFERLGVPEAEARRSLLPLLRGVVTNLERSGPEGALTGPICRGDVETIRRHMRAISAEPNLTATYRALGLQTVALARRSNSIDNDTALELEQLLSSEPEEVHV
jgi:predicted short-subunit dehydrogenase-like oxidoreductase (DUF2520 family)